MDVCDWGLERKGFVHRICIFVLLKLPHMKENYFHTQSTKIRGREQEYASGSGKCSFFRHAEL